MRSGLRGVSRNVLLLGLVSLFGDVGIVVLVREIRCPRAQCPTIVGARERSGEIQNGI